MKWKTLESKLIFSSGFFELNSEKLELPDGRVMPAYFLFNFSDWVNILPITSAGQAILVKQYRHGSKKSHLEIPGGSIDPRLGESLIDGARREMLEETGFDSARIELVSSHYPNPALQNNQMHTFVAFDCKKVQEQNLDEYEVLDLYSCSLEKLEEHLKEGDLDHSLMIAAVSQALSHLKKSGNF